MTTILHLIAIILVISTFIANPGLGLIALAATFILRRLQQ